VMLKPTATGFVSVAGLAAFGAAVAWAIVVITLRLMAVTESTSSMVFWFLLLTALGAGIVVAAGLYLMHREHRRP
jgi:drug/metabolite transporter (DMT)-like permease